MTNYTLNNSLNNNELLNESTDIARNILTNFAVAPDFYNKITLTFGTSFNTKVLENLTQEWKTGNFATLPEIELRTRAEINGAKGAFSPDTNKIYLSEELLSCNANNPGNITSVLLEEIGHFIDSQINQFDTSGDEGEFFSLLTQGIPLTSETIQVLKAENDSDIITLNGQLISIEKAGEYNGNNLKAALLNSIPILVEQVKDYINNEVLKGLPIFADRLGIASPIDSLFDSFKSQIINELNAIPDPEITPDRAKQILFDILGPTSTLNLLQDRNGDNQTTPTDIDVLTAPDGSQVNVKFKIGQTVKPSISLDEDLGLPYFGLKLNGGVTPNLGFEWNLDFGVNQNSGFFLNTAGTDPELKLKLDAQLKDNNNQPLTLNGKLGFLQVSATDQGSEFKGDFSVDLKGTLSNLSVDSKLTGSTNLKLGLTTSLGDQAKLPSISTDLNLLGWNFTDELKTGGKYQGQQPTVEFKNVRLNLGSFFKDFTKPVFGTIGDILSPIQPILNVLGTKLPILDDFGRSFLDVTGGFPSGSDGKVTLLDIVKKTQPDAPIDFIGAVSKIAELTESINTLSEQASIPLSVGGFKLGAGDDIRNSSFSLQNVNLDPLNSTLKPVDTILSELKSLLGDSKEIQNFVGAVQESSGPQFPILTDPTQAFKLLLGQTADFFKYNLPALKFGFGFDTFFPILGPLGARLQGGLGGKIQLGLGYDSTGFTTFVNSGNVGDIFDRGFYLANGIDSNGPGGRESGAELTALLKAYAEFNAVVARAGVGGGVEGNISILLNDPTPGDNKVYFSELDPNCFFHPITGKLTAGLDAYIKFGIGFLSYTKRFDIAKTTLLDFETGCNSEEKAAIAANSILATVLPGGVLRLNMGPDAAARIIKGQPGSDIDEIFTINTANNGNLNVSAFDITKQYQNASQIVAKGGANKDTIVIADAVSTPASLEGGDEADQLYSGSGNDTLKGDAGNDALKGSQGDDVLEGGQGDDLLVGGLGADSLDGGDGIDTASYEDSPSAVIIAPGAGNFLQGTGGDAQGDKLIGIDQIVGSKFGDTLTGENDNNGEIIEGLDGDDDIRGGTGDDALLGGSGKDTLDGSDGKDWTSYLTSWGNVNVNLGTGEAFGEDADGEVLISIENLQGSGYDDYLTGSAADNWLDGFFGDDTLIGEGGADTLDGSDGADWVSYRISPTGVNVSLKTGQSFDGYGSQDTLLKVKDSNGNDLPDSSFENLEGTVHKDILEGDLQHNIIKGLDGDDVLRGDSGNDTLIGDAGADNLEGGDGIDWADYSNSPDFVAVNLAASIGANADATNDTFIQVTGISTVENLLGSNYADFLTGDQGNNEINPGLSYLSNGEVDLVNGLNGFDQLTLDYSANDEGTGIIGGFRNLATGSGFISRNTSDNSKILDGVTFINIERLLVIGTIQDDQIIGGLGNDTLLLGAGNDTIDAGGGSDSLQGDDGIDVLSDNLSDKTFSIVLESLDPTQEIRNVTNLFLPDGTNIQGFEIFKNIQTGKGNDRLTQLGRIDNNFSTGTWNDTVNPGLGFDTVDGGNAEFIPDPNPNPNGGFGSGTFTPNDDLLILDYSVGDTGGGMYMSVDLKANTGIAFRNENRLLPLDSPPLDSITFRNFERYQITGTSQDDVLMGGDENDIITSNSGNDILIGNRGNDYLFGGEGNDTLIGTNNISYGSGENSDFPKDVDVLTGGTGADRFVLGDRRNGVFYRNNADDDYASITDFNPSEGDVIQLYGSSKDYNLVILDDATAIFYSGNRFSNNLISIFQRVTYLDLNVNFSFV